MKSKNIKKNCLNKDYIYNNFKHIFNRKEIEQNLYQKTRQKYSFIPIRRDKETYDFWIYNQEFKYILEGKFNDIFEMVEKTNVEMPIELFEAFADIVREREGYLWMELKRQH